MRRWFTKIEGKARDARSLSTEEARTLCRCVCRMYETLDAISALPRESDPVTQMAKDANADCDLRS